MRISDWSSHVCSSDLAEGLPKDMKLLREHEKFRTAIRAAIDRVNGQLSVIEKVRKFDFADEPFGIENAQMTPSMKIRRHILKPVYADKIAALYRGRRRMFGAGNNSRRGADRKSVV